MSASKVITKADMMGVLLDACPWLVPLWQSFLEEWRDDAHDLPLYILLGNVAQQLCDKLSRSDTATFPEAFHAIEHIHRHGDEYVREAVCIGFFETLQNISLNNGIDLDGFHRYLGPESEKCWLQLIHDWGGGPPKELHP